MVNTWVAEPGGLGGCSPPVFAKFSQNLPFLPQILAFLCLQPPHVPVSPPHFQIHSAIYVTASIKVASSVIMNNSKTNIIFLMHIECIKIVKC